MTERRKPAYIVRMASNREQNFDIPAGSIRDAVFRVLVESKAPEERTPLGLGQVLAGRCAEGSVRRTLSELVAVGLVEKTDLKIGTSGKGGWTVVYDLTASGQKVGRTVAELNAQVRELDEERKALLAGLKQRRASTAA